AELVRLRVRYFTDGVILGSKDFVESLFNENRDHFSPKRKSSARRIAARGMMFCSFGVFCGQPPGCE
ncbi:MAG: hypothetical protein RL015_213, partial [Verrucomicrobiota bacterium]